MGKGGKDKKGSKPSDSASTPPPGVTVTEPDEYGQVHPHETPELIADKLKEFEVELAKIADDKRASVDQAKEKCADGILTDDFKLMFLRSEIFNADLAAKRYCRYWDMRIELFGPEKAFLPLTLDGALRDDEVALKIGFMRLIGSSTDTSGRRIVLADPSRQDKSKYTRYSMTRGLWYMMHAALEETGDGIGTRTQQRGLVLLAHPYNAKISQVDRAQMKLNTSTLQGCIPVRLSAFHLCRPPTFFAIVFPIMKMFLSARLLKRLRVHSGSYESICAKLKESVGIKKEILPKDIGGDVEINHDEWLEARKKAGK